MCYRRRAWIAREKIGLLLDKSLEGDLSGGGDTMGKPADRASLCKLLGARDVLEVASVTGKPSNIFPDQWWKEGRGLPGAATVFPG